MNKDVSDFASTKPSVRRKLANRLYHARGGLLETIERLVETAHKVGLGGVNKAGGLSAVDCLLKCPMEEGILHIQLVNWPIAGDRQAEDGADCGRLDDGAEDLVEVDAVELGEAAKDPASLVPIQTAVGLELVVEDPLASDDIGTVWAGDQVPCTVGLQRGELFLLGGPPIGVGQCDTICARN